MGLDVPGCIGLGIHWGPDFGGFDPGGYDKDYSTYSRQGDEYQGLMYCNARSNDVRSTMRQKSPSSYASGKYN